MRLAVAFALSIILHLAAATCYGQEFYQYDTSVRVTEGSRQLSLAWCGGFNNPQFGQADLNRDGRQDLVVYEPGLGVSTFINNGISSGVPMYSFEQKYALNFPPIIDYMQLIDYNCDGIIDLFQRGNDGITVYKGYYNWASQLSFTLYKSLFYDNDPFAGGWANTFVNPGDIPAIKDVDGDGDIDFVAYYISGGYMYYYKNLRVERGLSCDSIVVELKDRCWGKVYQGFYRYHTLGYSCDNSGLRPGAKPTHSGNTICLFDWDLDGDMDYLDGNVSFDEITFLKNGRVETGYSLDTMIAQDTTWQDAGKMVNIPTWPAAFNVDIDLDGRSDLLISPNAGGGENYKSIWYYKNNSTVGVGNWQFQSDTFLVDKSIDLGTAAYPHLFDYDKDGKLDLIVGSDGYRQTGGQLVSKLWYLRNTSVGGVGSFEVESRDFMGIGAQSFRGAAPTTGDIDGDGKSDLLLGHANGTITYYKNIATSESVMPNWQLEQLVLKDETGADINSGGAAAPVIYDIDKDGRKDLVIGNVYGYLVYYRNVNTTPGSVKLQLIKNRLGNAKADPIQNFGNYAVPFIGKIEDTSQDYLLLGSNSGNIYQYSGFQSGDTTVNYTLVNDQFSYIDTMYSAYKSPGTEYGVYGNRRTAVTIGDIDNSGSFSLIKGNIRGGLEFYKRKVYVAETADVNNKNRLLVYPNPANKYLNVSWREILSGTITLQLYDAAGRACFQTSLAAIAGQTQINTDMLAPGVYILVLTGSKDRMYSKVTILK